MMQKDLTLTSLIMSPYKEKTIKKKYYTIGEAANLMGVQTSYIRFVAERHGNPSAVFLKPNEQIDSGVKVKVIPPQNMRCGTLLDGVIVRHKKRLCARVKHNGRTWFLRVDRNQVLKRW